MNEDRKELVTIQNKGRRIIKDRGGWAWMRLKRKDSERKNRKMKVTIKSELDENFELYIGVVSPRDWNERIVYSHKRGYIWDNGKNIKQVKKVKSIYIEDTVFMIVNNNEHIRELTFKSNEQEIFKTFYSVFNERQEKVLLLTLREPVTIEVETGKVVFVNFFDIHFKSNYPWFRHTFCAKEGNSYFRCD